MAYQALYRKYRPAVFEDMAGQKQIVRTIQNAIQNDRISHAYLFCGPRGTGKTSAAKIFARALNCTSDGVKHCGHCENCLAVDHPDIVEIDAASNNGVEEARNLVERVKYAPMMGKYKIYIIDEVHMMTAGAFNALLKTIEEPPAHVVFILATTEPHKVLPTILSRCQRFDFKKVPQNEIRQRLLQIAEKEGTVLDQQAAEQISLLSDGGMRDALSILDQCIAYEPEHLTAEDIRAVYGVVSDADISDIFGLLQRGQADQLMDAIKTLYDNGMDLERFTADLITLVKDSLIYSCSSETTLLSEERKHLLQMSFSKASIEFRTRLLKELMDVYPKYSHASSVLDYLEAVLLKYVQHETINSAYDSSVPFQIPVRNLSENIGESDSKTAGSVNKPVTEKQNVKSESDVSRETSLKKKATSDPLETPEYTNDQIVGLLHTADKSLREKDMSAWKTRMTFSGSLQSGKYARAVANAKLAASGSNYIIVYTSKQMESDAINDLQKAEGFEDFMELLTGTRKAVIAVSASRYKEVLDTFRACMKSGTFPAAPAIQTCEVDVGHMKSTEEELRVMFPNLKIIND